MGRPMTTHTYAILEVSAAAYDEIAERLRKSGYGHGRPFRRAAPDVKEYINANAPPAIDDRQVIDMHGIALAKEETR